MACVQGNSLRTDITRSKNDVQADARALINAKKHSQIAMMKVGLERSKKNLASNKMNYIRHISSCDECAARNDAPPVPAIYA